jgi:hypothetical protein
VVGHSGRLVRQAAGEECRPSLQCPRRETRVRMSRVSERDVSPPVTLCWRAGDVSPPVTQTYREANASRSPYDADTADARNKNGGL